MPPGEGIRVELVEETQLSGRRRPGRTARNAIRAIVNCGKPARDMTDRDSRGGRHSPCPKRAIGKLWCSGPSLMTGYFRDRRLDRGVPRKRLARHRRHGLYLSDGYVYIVGRAKDMIIVNGRNHWPQDIEWAVEQLPGFKAGDIAAFSPSLPPAARKRLRCWCNAARRTNPNASRLREEIRERVRSVTGMNCVIELDPAKDAPAHQLGQAEPRQGAQSLSRRRDQALRGRRLSGRCKNGRTEPQKINV